jgi:hypothetical protein
MLYVLHFTACQYTKQVAGQDTRIAMNVFREIDYGSMAVL